MVRCHTIRLRRSPVACAKVDGVCNLCSTGAGRTIRKCWSVPPLLAFVLLSAVTLGQQPPDAYQISNASTIDPAGSVVNVTNTSSRDICVNTWVWVPRQDRIAEEEPVACCASLVPAGQTYFASVQNDLISTPLIPVIDYGSTFVRIKLLASAPNGSSCDATSPTAESLVPGMRASLASTSGSNGVPFQQTQLLPVWPFSTLSELQAMTLFCGVMYTVPAPRGRCKPFLPGNTISVTTTLASATFNITGPQNLSGAGAAATFTNVSPGTYKITYNPIAGYTAPGQQTATLVAGGPPIWFSGTYTPVIPPPTITGIAPASGFQGQTITTLTITGSTFAPPLDPLGGPFLLFS